MRGWSRWTVSVAVLALVIGLAAACAPDTSGRISTTVDIQCAGTTQATPVDWYFPTGRPKALLWLQHGFVESKENWTELAPQAAARGLLVMATSLATFDPSGCNVENLGDNTGYLDNIATLFSGIDQRGSALATSYADAVHRAGRSDDTDALVDDGQPSQTGPAGDADQTGHAERHGTGLPQRLLFVGHSAGGEAVLSVADRIRTGHPSTFSKLGGLVLEDPVNSFLGTNTQTALTGLNPTSVPIYALAAPPGACNNGQSGTKLVTQLLTTRPFHGAVVTTGTHGDVFGDAAGVLVTAACGVPQPTNVAAVQTLTLRWLADQATSTTTPAWYPGGSAFQALVDAGTVAPLP